MPLLVASSSNNCFGIVCGSEIAFIDAKDTSHTGISQKSKLFHEKSLGADLLSLAFPKDDRYFVGAYSNNYICCWDIKSSTILGTFLLKKRATSLICSQVTTAEGKKDVLLLADKTGDLYAFDLPLLRKQIFMGGHTTSVITDICLFGSSLASADRDEKIRIARFPDTFVIDSYCLGHSSVISSLAVLRLSGQEYLVSTGWDHRLIIWQQDIGRPLITYTFRDFAINLAAPSPVNEHVNESSVVDGVRQDDDLEVDEEVDGEQEKDENAAGNFPFKAISANQSPILCVIFKSIPRLEVLFAYEDNIGKDDQQSNPSTSTPAIAVRKIYEYELPAVPCDFVFSQDDKLLMVLFPSPEPLIAFDVHYDDKKSDFRLVRRPSIDFPELAEYNSYCIEKGAKVSI